MSTAMRLLDTGPMSARRNSALTAALTDLHRAGQIPDTLRFYLCPRSLLVGRHQRIAEAAHVMACVRRRVEIARRATGGGSVYMNHGVLAWEVVAERHRFGGRPREISERIGSGIVAGLARFGLPSRFRPPHDVEVDGRRISESSNCIDGPTIVVEGTVLIDVDLVETAMFLRVLVDPAHRTISASLAARVTSIAEWLGRTPSLDEVKDCLLAGFAHQWNCLFAPATLTRAEAALADRLFGPRDPSLTEMPAVMTAAADFQAATVAAQRPGGP